MTGERYGDWMQTATGSMFWPLDPRSEEIHILDIARSLSHQCRFAGHCNRFYSVAEHSVLVARALPPELALWGLLHDASEAYLVDIPRPVKRHLPEYAAMEALVMRKVAERFHLSWPMPKEVKRVDNAILADEARQLMAAPPRDWALPEPPLGIRIEGMMPGDAAFAFLCEFRKCLREQPWPPSGTAT